MRPGQWRGFPNAPLLGRVYSQFTSDFFGGAGGSGAIWMPSSFSALISAGLASP